MSNQPPSRFTPGNQTTHERLTTTTVGLVALSDFRKRRAEVLEQQEREAREKKKQAAAAAAAQTPDRSRTGTPANGSEGSDAERQLKRKKTATAKRAKVANKLSFGDDEDDADADDAAPQLLKKAAPKPRPKSEAPAEGGGDDDATAAAEPEDASGAAEGSGKDDTSAGEGAANKRPGKGKIAPNASVGVIPRALTKAALRREAAEREALRKEFLALQAAVKATEIAIPFVFYDGTNLPGGTVTVKKGDFVWVFLDKSRKVGAKLGVGGERIINARRDWARVGVDDLMLVRGTIIIPHHYEFYFFIMNKTLGPGNRRLFDYSVEAPPKKAEGEEASKSEPSGGLLRRTGDQERAAQIQALEGAQDDPNMTKVVDRRWYERNKHIYPASVWQEFEPDKDYSTEVRRDLGGNTFFYSR